MMQTIANYGNGRDNQPFIRAFHAETIKIAQHAIQKYYSRPDPFAVYRKRSAKRKVQHAEEQIQTNDAP